MSGEPAKYSSCLASFVRKAGAVNKPRVPAGTSLISLVLVEVGYLETSVGGEEGKGELL